MVSGITGPVAGTRSIRSRVRADPGAHWCSEAGANLIVDLDARYDCDLEAHGHRVRNLIGQIACRTAAGDPQQSMPVIDKDGRFFAMPALVEYCSARDDLVDWLGQVLSP